MENIQKKLGEAELEIMQVIWASEPPLTSNYILKELQERVAAMTPEELRAFRNSHDADSMGFSGKERL